MFYGTIIGTLCFLIYAHIAKFRTLKEKAGHAGNERDQKDFLEYASKDAHWVIMNFQRFFLFSLVIQKHKISGKPLKAPEITALITCLFRILFESGLAHYIYFTDKKSHLTTKKDLIRITISNLITFITLTVCWSFTGENHTWVSPYILFEISFTLTRYGAILIHYRY